MAQLAENPRRPLERHMQSDLNEPYLDTPDDIENPTTKEPQFRIWKPVNYRDTSEDLQNWTNWDKEEETSNLNMLTPDILKISNQIRTLATVISTLYL